VLSTGTVASEMSVALLDVVQPLAVLVVVVVVVGGQPKFGSKNDLAVFSMRRPASSTLPSITELRRLSHMVVIMR
jgi:hypothetical protein